jgi:hypothetical protein
MERPVGYMDSSPSSAEGSAAPAAPAAAGRTPAVPAEHQALLSRELAPDLEILRLLGAGVFILSS